MFTQNQAVSFARQAQRHLARRTEWEEVERYDGPLLPNEENPFGRLLDRLDRMVRGIERFGNPADDFRSIKNASLLGRESLKTGS